MLVLFLFVYLFILLKFSYTGDQNKIISMFRRKPKLTFFPKVLVIKCFVVELEFRVK